jgi:MOSC domain-containing protein YiiM
MHILSIQTGTVQTMNISGRKVATAIRKSAVEGPVGVRPLGLDGDEQADPSVHGGLDKAVYAYPSEHYAFWESRRPGEPLPYGTLGENLTLAGLLETEVFIGDELHLPDCVLRVTEPRQPCFKFNAVMDDKFAGKAMASSGFCGFYLAVVTPGRIAAGQAFQLVAGARQTRVSELFKAAMFKSRSD